MKEKIAKEATITKLLSMRRTLMVAILKMKIEMTR